MGRSIRFPALIPLFMAGACATFAAVPAWDRLKSDLTLEQETEHENRQIGFCYFFRVARRLCAKTSEEQRYWCLGTPSPRSRQGKGRQRRDDQPSGPRERLRQVANK